MKPRKFLAPMATPFAALLAASSWGAISQPPAASPTMIETTAGSDSAGSASWFVLERGGNAALQLAWHTSHVSHSSHVSHASHSSHVSGW
jgi:hypothetical protein